MSFFDKLRTQKLLSFTLILFTLSIGIVIGTLVSSGVKAAKDDRTVAPGATPLVIPNPVELSNAFTQIAKQMEPSVVNISTTYAPKAPVRTRNRRLQPVIPPDDEDQGDSGSGGMDDFLNRFLGNPFGNGAPDLQRKGYALGSGVVVDKSGYILTNNHVVDKADRIQVKFTGDATEYEAKLVGVDAQTDLAVIRVEGKREVSPAKIGNSDAVQVGDWCVAIGSPFGFQATVTAGIISAKERDVDPLQQFQHFLQTDAAINPGNSGGPLLNIRGEVIGINTAIASRSGGYQGIGFALPINTAAAVYNEIIKTGKVTRGSIGIQFSADPAQARDLLRGFGGVTEGVFVTNVAPGGPAEKSGLKERDIITEINGKPVHQGNDLVNTVTATPVGSTVTLGVLRGGKRENLKVVVGNLAQIFPERFGSGTEPEAVKPEGTTVSFGVSIMDMTDQRRESLGIKQSGGVMVAEVESNSFAEDIGLRQGDILTDINHQPVTSTADVKRIQTTLKPGDAVAFRVLRKGRDGYTPTFLAGTLPGNSR
ncbi:MAG: trypsin-like peptidase domain-containing protein [Acidobacteriia bacterium]|nr:trypsin-like peptidase domain-containing protein [Terriglobia bacterium]